MLKSLEIFGFKSFADRTLFDFDPGVTCVVGPNGSGKSNVVDALKWILGDQSARSLRGKEMTDVIFNGSSSRKPSAFAEATLTFDNASGWLPTESIEVQIGRRIWRNGDAEYLINRAPARLKDVRELFMGTGAGSAVYSIIEQGRVDQILQGNPTSRRLVFEEAAGISRFKSRRVEAERKLERVGQSLVRLTDLVDEVEGQLNATRSQAAKAARFRDLSVQLRQWWLGLAADDSRRWLQEQTSAQAQQQELAGRIEELFAQQRQIEAEEAGLDRELAQLEDQIRVVEQRYATAREAIAGSEASVQIQSDRLTELASESQHLIDQQSLFRKRLEEIQRQRTDRVVQLEGMEDELSTRERQVAEADQQLERCQSVLAECRDQLEGDRGRRLELVRTVSGQANAVLTLQSQLASVDAVLDQAHGDWQRCATALEQKTAAATDLAQEVATAQQDWSAAQAKLRSVQLVRQQWLTRQETGKQQLAQLREQRSATLARKSVLEDLDHRQMGLAIGVRDILTRARTASGPPWNSVVGSVADLLQVPIEHAALVEVALGTRAEWIVLREYQPWLDYLSDPKAALQSRVGFIAIPGGKAARPVHERKQLIHIPPVRSTQPDFSSEPGVVARADTLVHDDPTTTGLATAVLGDAWVVESLAVAVRLATGAGQGARFVTLQGELLDEAGALHLGRLRGETSVLSRKTELRLVKQDITRLDRQINELDHELLQLLEQLSTADLELEQAAMSADTAAERLNQIRAEATTHDQEVQRLDRDRQRLHQRYEAAAAERARVEQELHDAEQTAQLADAELGHLESSLASVEELLASIESDVLSLEQRCTADRLDVAKQQERLTATKAQLAGLEEELLQRQSQFDEAQDRLQAAITRRAQFDLQILNARAAATEQLQAAEVIQGELEALRSVQLQRKHQRNQYSDHEAALRRERREFADRQHTGELRLRELEQLLTTLDERLQEEFQTTAAETAAAGLSAYELLLRERREGRTDPTAEDDSRTPPVARQIDSELPTFEEARPELEQRVQRLRKRLKLLGHVNTESLRDLETLENRFVTLSTHLQDLVEAKTMLEDIIRRANAECRKLFAETFAAIRQNFRELFRKVFGGGEGDIVLEDPNDILECGLEITARPPGKELRSLSLLSGGEKTMTAIALIMAIFQAKPSPFCILDEVDAALDEANVERFTGVVREFRSSTQFIMITHHKRSMAVGDVLYGVTMEESGISKRMTVRFEDISEDGHFRAAQAHAA